jgi:hypothetical protein
MKLRVLKKFQAYKSAHFLREVGRGYVKRLWTEAEKYAWLREHYPSNERGDDYIPIPAAMLAAITAPETAHLFTAEAAHNTFVHLRAVPALTPQQIELHGGITKSGDAFSLENAVKLYSKGMGGGVRP